MSTPDEILETVNGGYLVDLDSVKLEMAVRFRFDGHHIVVRSTDGQLFSASCATDLAVFEIGYNAKTGKPQIGWETQPTGEDGMLHAAVDIIVAFLVKLAADNGVDVAKLPKLFHPAEA